MGNVPLICQQQQQVWRSSGGSIALHCIAQIELIGNNFGYRWVCNRVDNVTNLEKPKHCQRLWNTESLSPQHCKTAPIAFFSRRKKNAKEESVGHKNK
jgi:hypothetical protein